MENMYFDNKFTEIAWETPGLFQFFFE